MRAMTPSPALASIVGNSALPRTEALKKVWGYIRKNNLQDSQNKRNINADATLKRVFDGKSTISMLHVMRYLNKHLA